MLNNYKVVASGHIGFHIINLGVHNAAALQKLQDKLNVTLEETMAFVDYYNDVDFLGQANYSYVMDNALDDMKAMVIFLPKVTKNKVLPIQ